MNWKRVKLKTWCCEACNRMSYRKFKKLHKVTLRRRARKMVNSIKGED